MSSRKRTSALAVLVAAAGAAAFAGSAQAAVVDNDPVVVSGANVDFTGNVAFDFQGGSMRPVIEGTLGITNGANTRGRIRIDHYDGTTYRYTEYGNPMQPASNALQEWSVTRSGVTDPLIDKVVIATEFENAQNVFVEQNAVTSTVSMHDDDVTVPGAGIDIGAAGALVGGLPPGPAQVEWSLVNGVVTPELVNEKLHMVNLGGVCGRIRLRFLDENGTFLDGSASAPDCPADNAHYGFGTNDIPLYASPLTAQVEVQSLTDTGPNGAWNLVSSRTVSIAE